MQKAEVQLEISFRNADLRGEVVSIVSDYTPAYTVNSLAQDFLIGEKIQALLERRKPRDFFDLYFILRGNLLAPEKREVLNDALKILKETDVNFENELKVFLPKSHWAVIRDFKNSLEKEIQRFL